jgi:hypothetical protein
MVLAELAGAEDDADGRPPSAPPPGPQSEPWLVDWSSVRVRLVRAAVTDVTQPPGDRSGQVAAIEHAMSNARAVNDDDEPAVQADLVRCVFGNPFRSVAFDASRLTPLVRDLAQAADEDRSVPLGEFDRGRLAVLADALEDEVRTDDALLSHLRSPGPHVRGCWAMDLILGRR